MLLLHALEFLLVHRVRRRLGDVAVVLASPHVTDKRTGSKGIAQDSLGPIVICRRQQLEFQVADRSRLVVKIEHHVEKAHVVFLAVRSRRRLVHVGEHRIDVTIEERIDEQVRVAVRRTDFTNRLEGPGRSLDLQGELVVTILRRLQLEQSARKSLKLRLDGALLCIAHYGQHQETYHE